MCSDGSRVGYPNIRSSGTEKWVEHFWCAPLWKIIKYYGKWMKKILFNLFSSTYITIWELQKPEFRVPDPSLHHRLINCTSAKDSKIVVANLRDLFCSVIFSYSLWIFDCIYGKCKIIVSKSNRTFLIFDRFMFSYLFTGSPAAARTLMALIIQIRTTKKHMRTVVTSDDG